MKVLIHEDVIKANDVACLQVPSECQPCLSAPVGERDGWYTSDQAATGEKLYQARCATCHGAKLEGGAGPSLNGASWHELYGRAKPLTVWGEIKGPMAELAGTTYTTQQSLDILSYLLQQNRLPSGS